MNGQGNRMARGATLAALLAGIALATPAAAAVHGCTGGKGLAAIGIAEASRAPATDGGPLFEQLVRIREVGGPAGEAGFPRAGDVLLEIDGHRITTAEAAARYAALAPGEEVRLTVRRGDRVRRGAVTVQACSA